MFSAGEHMGRDHFHQEQLQQRPALHHTNLGLVDLLLGSERPSAAQARAQVTGTRSPDARKPIRASPVAGEVVEVSLGDPAVLHGGAVVAEVSCERGLVAPLRQAQSEAFWGATGQQNVVRRAGNTTADRGVVLTEAEAGRKPTVADFDQPLQREISDALSGTTGNTDVIRDAADPLCAISSFGLPHHPAATHAMFEDSRNRVASGFAQRRMLVPPSALVVPHDPNTVSLLHYEQRHARHPASAGALDAPRRTPSPTANRGAPAPRFVPPPNIAEAFPRRRPPPVPFSGKDSRRPVGVPNAPSNLVGCRPEEATSLLENAAQVVATTSMSRARSTADATSESQLAGHQQQPQPSPRQWETHTAPAQGLLLGAIERQQAHQLFGRARGSFSGALLHSFTERGPHAQDGPSANGCKVGTRPPWAVDDDSDGDSILEQWKAGGWGESYVDEGAFE